MNKLDSAHRPRTSIAANAFFIASILCVPSGARAATAFDAVNPGDQLNVSVYNHPELSEQVKVDSRGGISLPLAGYLRVAGLGLKEIDSILSQRLSPYIKFPAVDVQSVSEDQSIFIAGGPGGVLAFSPGETLLTALADLQKNLVNKDPQENNRLIFTDLIDRSRLDLHRVRLDRMGKTIGIFDSVAMRNDGDPGPLLHANDTIAFRNKPTAIAVTGYVAKPGTAYLDPTEPLSDAIEQAGGALPTAAASHIVVTESDGSRRLVAMGDPLFTLPGQAGESVVVPAAPRIQVNGLVAKPGPVSLQSDFTLLGAINSAGGINRFANIKNVQVVRNGAPSSYDITRLTFGDLSQNPTLEDGDSVFVPEGHKVDFSAVFGEIVGLRQLFPYNY